MGSQKFAGQVLPTAEFVVCIGHEVVLGGDILVKLCGSGLIHLIGKIGWKVRGG